LDCGLVGGSDNRVSYLFPPETCYSLILKKVYSITGNNVEYEVVISFWRVAENIEALILMLSD